MPESPLNETRHKPSPSHVPLACLWLVVTKRHQLWKTIDLREEAQTTGSTEALISLISQLKQWFFCITEHVQVLSLGLQNFSPACRHSDCLSRNPGKGGAAAILFQFGSTHRPLIHVKWLTAAGSKLGQWWWPLLPAPHHYQTWSLYCIATWWNKLQFILRLGTNINTLSFLLLDCN